MLQGFVVRAAFLFGQLFGALVQLRGHFGGFLRRTPERGEDFGKFGNFHGRDLDRIHRRAHSIYAEAVWPEPN